MIITWLLLLFVNFVNYPRQQERNHPSVLYLLGEFLPPTNPKTTPLPPIEFLRQNPSQSIQ